MRSTRRHRIRRVLPAILVALAAYAHPVAAFVHFDFEQGYFHDPGQPVLDHYVLRHDGVYHLFYLRGNPAVSIGHATTTDFVHWTLEPPVLSPGTWDNRALWAPHIFEKDGLFFLFYTGVNSVGSQQTGVAISSDLYQWTKIPWPVYHPDPSWAEWSESYFTHGRDPHVIEWNGTYYQFVTAKTWLNRGAVACATSPDLINWTDVGPMFVNTTWHVLESVFVMRWLGRWRMFFTEEAVNGTSYMASDSLLSGWDIAQRRIIDFGHAPQVTFLPDSTQLFSRHAVYTDETGTANYVIKFDSLAWAADIPSVIKPYPLTRNWIIVSGNAFLFQPVFRNNPALRGDTTDVNYEGQCWIGTREFYTGPLGFGYASGAVGETRTGLIRSKPFVITGNSISLRVGGTSNPDSVYVALVDAADSTVFARETGRGVERMDTRRWDVRALRGHTVYIEIADLDPAGHINVDEIVESSDIVGEVGTGSGNGRRRPGDPGGPVSTEPVTATGLRLGAAAPNPFNPSTTIPFEVGRPARVRLVIYDVLGRAVRTLVDRRVEAGSHRVAWDGRDDASVRQPSGVYFYRLEVDGAPVATRKMVMLK